MAGSFPSAGSPQRIGSPRNKVALKPGRSLMDWIRLGNSGKDLQGFGGKYRKVTPAELSKHNSVDDAWICLRGRHLVHVCRAKIDGGLFKHAAISCLVN